MKTLNLHTSSIHKEGVQLRILKRLTGTAYNSTKRVVGHKHLEFCLFGNALIQASEQCPSAGQKDTSPENV
jgi:hypothetical protein